VQENVRTPQPIDSGTPRHTPRQDGPGAGMHIAMRKTHNSTGGWLARAALRGTRAGGQPQSHAGTRWQQSVAAGPPGQHVQRRVQPAAPRKQAPDAGSAARRGDDVAAAPPHTSSSTCAVPPSMLNAARQLGPRHMAQACICTMFGMHSLGHKSARRAWPGGGATTMMRHPPQAGGGSHTHTQQTNHHTACC